MTLTVHIPSTYLYVYYLHVEYQDFICILNISQFLIWIIIYTGSYNSKLFYSGAVKMFISEEHYVNIIN